MRSKDGNGGEDALRRNGQITNAQFAESDSIFRHACELAGVPPSKRQASKFRLKFGKVYQAYMANRGSIDNPAEIRQSN